MKLKPIKFPNKIEYIDTEKFKDEFYEDDYFLLIRINGEYIEVGVVDNKSYELAKAYRGKDIRGLYKKIINDGWLKKGEHCSYLGKELGHADYCRKNKNRYVQGKA